MGFLETLKGLNNGTIVTICTPFSNGFIYSNYLPEEVQIYNTGVLSEYTLALRSGTTAICVWHKSGITENFYFLQNTGNSTPLIKIEYDPTDNLPGMVYTQESGLGYYNLYYAKLSGSTWVSRYIDLLGGGGGLGIDFKYDPADNYPAITASKSAYSFHYYKYNGSTFNRTDFSEGLGLSNYITDANLVYDPVTKYPIITYIQDNVSQLGRAVKMLKYNGSTWDNSTIVNDGITRKSLPYLKFDKFNRETMVYRASTSGFYLFTKRDGNWQSGYYNQTTGSSINSIMNWEFDKYEYFNDKPQINIAYSELANGTNVLRWVEDTLQNTISGNLASGTYTQIPISGLNFPNLNFKYNTDTDTSPIIFHPSGTSTLVYSKATGRVGINGGREVFNKPIVFKTGLNIFSSSSVFDIKFPTGVYTPEVIPVYSSGILSDYTLIAKTGNSNFYALVRKNGIDTEYIINSGSNGSSNIVLRYDPSDNNPSFLYYYQDGPYLYLNYLKLTNAGTWSGALVGNLGPSAADGAIDLRYDPTDNRPVCIAYDFGLYDFNYFKYNGSSFVKTTLIDGGSSAGTPYASLSFDPADNYPAIAYKTNSSSPFTYFKYNGSTWTNVSVGTFNSSDNKRYINLKFLSGDNNPMVVMAGSTTGLHMNTRSGSQWQSGIFTGSNGLSISNNILNFEVSENNNNDVYISYSTTASALFFNEKKQIREAISGWNTTVDGSNARQIQLFSGSTFIDYALPIYLKIDSDNQPVIFYKKTNDFKYIKNTGVISNITSGSFTSGLNLKTLAGANSYQYAIEFAP